MLVTKPATEVAEKAEEITEKEFNENYHYRCYRRCRYYRYGHRVYRRCYRRCYSYLNEKLQNTLNSESTKLDMSDSEFFNGNVELSSDSTVENKEVAEKEFNENQYIRCYRRCRYYRYYGRLYRRCYRRCYRYLENQKDMTDAEMFSSLKPISESAENAVEVSEKEFNENQYVRCYRRCGYYRYGHRVYRRCYRRCYRYLNNNSNENLDINDVEYFKNNVELVSDKETENKEVSEKEFNENQYVRCYRRCRYYRYYGRLYRRCYRRCYRYLENQKDLSDAEMLSTLKPISDEAEKAVEISEKEFEENRYYRCYTRCGYFRYHGRLYRRCRRRCYRYSMENNNSVDLSDAEFFKGGNVQLATNNEVENKEVTEKEFNENQYYRCYVRCYYYTRYHHRYRRCYRRCYRYLENQKDMTDEQMLTTLKPTTEVAQKEEKVSEKEFNENQYVRCYRRCGYYRYGHRVYRRCYRRCYRYLTKNVQDLSDAEFFKNTNVEVASTSTEKETDITEKEFEEKQYYRCYRRCRYYRYHHRYYRRCYRRCYSYVNNEKMTDA